MEVIFMRHGKAEEPGDLVLSDAERALTGEGRKKVENAAPGIAQFIRCGSSAVMIWSSPLLRAKQTAEIVASNLGKIKIQHYEAIAAGDLDMLIKEWGRLGDDVTLIIVGHEPYLSHWAEKLAGVRLVFKKGACAGFDVAVTNPAEGRLKWYATASILARLAKGK
ncbi:MAG TPA: histidine phosphatase family protein [Methylomusa anaerophila]|uniref:Phosphohistidine phosphatase n=1 Tax=Methylomusa anaerophila TaxID=1930071 RepID=A0A348AJJ5_9FIRM|nr:histidine phosphatase family protein [Methylomusa anaerophila]BBB91243.1 phosphohistidine phosphatase [Methylomusa anaerophila]HML89763.1 histidine phosphatase family protein [Methylomusa anaerophila]